MNNVAKVKIILNYDKKRLSNKGSIKVNPCHKPKSNSVFKAIPYPSKLERHLKSVSSQAKQAMSDKKFKNSNSRGAFKPQTTRVMPSIKNPSISHAQGKCFRKNFSEHGQVVNTI